MSREILQYKVRKITQKRSGHKWIRCGVVAVFSKLIQSPSDYEFLAQPPMSRREALTVANSLNALNNFPLCK